MHSTLRILLFECYRISNISHFGSIPRNAFDLEISKWKFYHTSIIALVHILRSNSILQRARTTVDTRISLFEYCRVVSDTLHFVRVYSNLSKFQAFECCYFKLEAAFKMLRGPKLMRCARKKNVVYNLKRFETFFNFL